MDLLGGLNPDQRRAATHGRGPLLIVAGAGTGKTMTLAHRVAHLIAGGVDPARILLLTFTRRAAAEMLRRVDAILGQEGGGSRRVWGGTFHSVAARLLRVHGPAIGLPADFTIHDRADSEDLIHLCRAELGLGRGERRFPKKGTCLDVYSRCVNACARLDDVTADAYPWCRPHAADLGRLFTAYVERKAALAVLDYDDLLLYWRGLLGDAAAGDAVRRRFDCVLVDEYQDTNALQADLVKLLRPDGTGVTVVGDDAQ
jgi:DNA helicase II / ATP-dependent DNA helicase PcrA